jgi:hypothetical protein
VGHASRSNGLLGVEASQTRVSQSALRTGGGATTGGAHVEDGRIDAMGYVGPCYLNFVLFNVLDSRGIMAI